MMSDLQSEYAGPAPEPVMPPRPPECRPPADDMWQFGAARHIPRGFDGDPCGAGPMASGSKSGAPS